MSDVFKTGDMVEIRLTGMVDADYGHDEYLVRAHGERMPMMVGGMRHASNDTVTLTFTTAQRAVMLKVFNEQSIKLFDGVLSAEEIQELNSITEIMG